MAAKKKLKLNFSSREIQILNLVKDGLTSREIADTLELTEDAIESHRRNIIKRSGARNMVVVVYAAQRYGLI